MMPLLNNTYHVVLDADAREALSPKQYAKLIKLLSLVEERGDSHEMTLWVRDPSLAQDPAYEAVLAVYRMEQRYKQLQKTYQALVNARKVPSFQAPEVPVISLSLGESHGKDI